MIATGQPVLCVATFSELATSLNIPYIVISEVIALPKFVPKYSVTHVNWPEQVARNGEI